MVRRYVPKNSSIILQAKINFELLLLLLKENLIKFDALY
jgi:hypothetical protein